MQGIRDIKPVFVWAHQNGEAKIVDRILVKLLPELLQNGQELTSDIIEVSESVLVSTELYELIKTTAGELVGRPYEG